MNKYFFLITALLIFNSLNLLSQNKNTKKMKIDKETFAVSKRVKKLPNKVFETSGLVFFNNSLWTHNDGQNPPTLYQIDSISGIVKKQVTLVNAQNTDWEEVTQDKHNVYIGDFGNNFGNRKEFQIYKVPKTVFTKPGNNIKAKAEIINYYYEDLDKETDTVMQPYNHNFDCEAFIIKDNTFHIFTKNWADKQCNHYTLPADGSSSVAKYCATFDTGGVITAATFNFDENILILAGYQRLKFRIKPFLWVFYDLQNNDFFFSRVVKLNFKYLLKQIEAVEYVGNHKYFYSNEGIKKIIRLSKPRLYELTIRLNEL